MKLGCTVRGTLCVSNVQVISYFLKRQHQLVSH